MIKTVIFDIGGVLIGYDWTGFLMKQNGNDENKVARIHDALFGHGVWTEVDRGVWTDEELLAGFIKEAPDLKEEISRFWDSFGGALWQYEWTHDWIADLKKRGYQVLFLSNWSSRLFKLAQEQLNFLPEMDGGVFSFREKLIKPDAAIYECLLTRYGLKAEECVFLDDTAVNITGAKACGIHTVHVTSHEAAVKELESLLARE